MINIKKSIYPQLIDFILLYLFQLMHILKSIRRKL